jgi:hypothetical protein
MLPQHMHRAMTNATTGLPVPWPRRLEHNFTSSDLILGAFNSLYKLDPQTWDLWLKILQRCGSILSYLFCLFLWPSCAFPKI